MADKPSTHCLLVLTSSATTPGQPAQVCGGGQLTPAAPGRYELGSVTKVMQGMVLWHLVANERLRLDQPVADFLPAATPPHEVWSAMQLEHLLTHRSGLPRMPPAAYLIDGRNPFAAFKPEAMWSALAKLAPDIQPGADVNYSNLGGALLSWVMDQATEQTLTELYDEVLWQPAGMLQTSFTGPVRPGHGLSGQPVKPWDIPEPLAGLGGLRSSAVDLQAWLNHLVQVVAGNDERPEAGSLEVLFEKGSERWAWGWEIMHLQGRDYWLHTGATGGFSAVLLLDPQQARVALVVINAAHDDDRWLLRLAQRALRGA